MITVIGLGLYKDDLSFRAEKFLKKAKNIYVKTAKTPTYDFLKKRNIRKIFRRCIRRGGRFFRT